LIGSGSGVPQASFDPHASMLFMAEKLFWVAAGFGCAAGAGAGVDRLNADCAYEAAEIGGGCFDTGAGAALGAGAGAGLDMLNRSPIEDVAGGGDLVMLGAGLADVKSPKSPKPLETRGCCGLGG